MDIHKAVTQKTNEHLKGRKLFTLEAAQHALPLIRRVATDVIASYRKLVDVQREYHELLSHGPSDALEDARDRRQEIADRLTELTDELKLIGCELKDYEVGLVDFPAILDGREVFLCWKLGEEKIAYWHELYAGYSGRQPLPAGA